MRFQTSSISDIVRPDCTVPPLYFALFFGVQIFPGRDRYENGVLVLFQLGEYTQIVQVPQLEAAQPFDRVLAKSRHMSHIPLPNQEIVWPKTEGNAVVNGEDLASLFVPGYQELSLPAIAVLDPQSSLLPIRR